MSAQFNEIISVGCRSLKTGSEIPIPEQTVICLGNFDGVHLGHQALLRKAVSVRNLSFPEAVCTVLCFRNPSTDVLIQNPPSHLTTFEEKMQLFSQAGAEAVLLVDFESIRNLTPEIFAGEILKKICHCRSVVCGFNYRFGKGAAGTPDTLKKIFGRSVTVCKAVTNQGQPISSTRIRTALAEGRPEDAASMLGRAYSMSGTVQHGKELGRKLGFPTINLGFPAHSFVPKYGVYVTNCTVDNMIYRGVTNVGVHPTVDLSAPANCETHLLGYEGNLYGKTVRIDFLKFLRPERNFDSKEALREQISHDVFSATQYIPDIFNKHTARILPPL